MNNKIKYGATVIFLGIFLNIFSNSPEVNPFSSAQWYFNVRTNLNSAAFITGIASVWYAVYYGAIPATKAGVDYSFDNIDKETVSKELKAAARKFTTSMFLAGLALAIEGVNKFYFQDKFYEKVAALNQ